MAHSVDCDKPLAIVDRVKDPVGADSQAPSLDSNQLGTLRRTWLLLQVLERFHNALPDIAWERADFPFRAIVNDDPVHRLQVVLIGQFRLQRL